MTENQDPLPASTGSADTGDADTGDADDVAVPEEGRPGTSRRVATAAGEQRTAPTSASEAADRADRYDRMLQLATLFDDSGEEMRTRAGLGDEVVADPAFAESAPLSPHTHASAEEEIRAATTGKHGLFSRSIELDADALVLRATVLTYRWIDELQSAAAQNVGSIAARAIGYLAPEVALGGAIVSAGLIETDALDRDGVATYLGELADSNPDLMEHVTTGGGGLLDGLRMRALLTAGALAGQHGARAAAGGLRAAGGGVAPFPTTFAAALRDVAGGAGIDQPDVRYGDTGQGQTADPTALAAEVSADVPRHLADLMTRLQSATDPVVVHRVATSRYIAYLPGPGTTRPGKDGSATSPTSGDGAGAAPRLRLVGGDLSGYAARVVRSIEAAVVGDPDARVMLVGAAQGGVTAAEVAASGSGDFVIDQVVTTSAPSAHVPHIPEPTRVLSLEDSADPVALLGSLVNAGVSNRVTVVFDGGRAGDDGVSVFGGLQADGADHPALRDEVARLHDLGYLAG